jgi:hypothetical protein
MDLRPSILLACIACAGGGTTSPQRDPITERELWQALERVSRVDVFDRTQVQDLILARYPGDKSVVESGGESTLRLGSDRCYPIELVYNPVDMETYRQDTESATDGGSRDERIGAIIAFEIDGSVVTFGLETGDASNCIRFVEIGRERSGAGTIHVFATP